MQTHLAKNVRALRRQKNMSRETLAVRANRSFATIARLEAEGYWPSKATLNAVATALDTTVASLLAEPAA